jgi:hypothetical protein
MRTLIRFDDFSEVSVMHFCDLAFLATVKIFCFIPTGGGHSAVGNRGFCSRYRGIHAAVHLLGWGAQPGGGR